MRRSYPTPLPLLNLTALVLPALVFVSAAGCSRDRGEKDKQAAVPASASSVASTTTTGPSSGALSLPFIEDDYARALQEAKRTKRLVFVDVWAPWCHTCLSLKSFVLGDAALAPHKDAFVWAAIDSEKEVNASIVSKLGLSVLPTLWIVDPESDKPVWTWRGSLTATELAKALADVTAHRASANGPHDAGATHHPNAKRTLVLDAEAAAARGDKKVATEKYRAALADGAAFAERGRAADALASLLEDARAGDECAELAAREGPTLGESTHRVDLAVTGAKCAIDGKEGSPARRLLPTFVTELRSLTTSTSTGVLADDRSGAFEALVDAQKAAGDAAAAKITAAAWASFLEREAERAKSPRERVVFDSHRLGAYLELGEPARALPMLEASERDFPDDYNPSARKARALLELGRTDEAIAAADRALARAYGARRLRIHVLAADIYAKRKDVAKERAALETALAEAKALALRSSYERFRQSIEKRLAGLHGK